MSESNESAGGCLLSALVFILGILGLVFIKEILVIWWIILGLAFIILAIGAIFGS